MSETTDLLAKVPLLASLDSKDLERLASDFSERTFPAGTIVVREGDSHGMGFFIVAEGEGVVTVGGKEVDTIGPGSYFGEVALISDRVRTATVTATTDLRTLVMTFWDFRAFVRGDARSPGSCWSTSAGCCTVVAEAPSDRLPSRSSSTRSATRPASAGPAGSRRADPGGHRGCRLPRRRDGGRSW